MPSFAMKVLLAFSIVNIILKFQIHTHPHEPNAQEEHFQLVKEGQALVSSQSRNQS